MKLAFDTESGVLNLGVRDGRVEQRLDLTEPGFGAFMGVDEEGDVLGIEFLSSKGYTELVTRFGGVLELPDKIGDPAGRSLPSRGRNRVAFGKLTPEQEVWGYAVARRPTN